MSQYVITDPMIITTRLMPGVKVGDDSTISMEAIQINDGHVRWRYHIDVDGREIYTSANINTGAQYGPDGEGVRRAMTDLLSYLSEEADRYGYSERSELLFNAEVATWAHEHAEEISLLECELEEDDE